MKLNFLCSKRIGDLIFWWNHCVLASKILGKQVWLHVLVQSCKLWVFAPKFVAPWLGAKNLFFCTNNNFYGCKCVIVCVTYGVSHWCICLLLCLLCLFQFQTTKCVNFHYHFSPWCFMLHRARFCTCTCCTWVLQKVGAKTQRDLQDVAK